jgi:hypothetical protein
LGWFIGKNQIISYTASLVQRFKNLLSCPFKEFPHELEKFKAILENSKYKLASELLKFIKNNSNLFEEKIEKLSN